MTARRVVHIGLGKTATTTLQRHVFPLLQKQGAVDVYNDRELVRLAQKNIMFGLHEEEQRYFSEHFHGGQRVFLSNEGLAGWNPAGWAQRCASHRRLFGQDTIIILTVRSPLSYLRSVYQQHIKAGNVSHPADYFLRADHHDRIAPIAPKGGNFLFNVDAFDLQALVTMYEEAFDRVIVAPMERIPSCAFLRDAFMLDEARHRALAQAFAAAPRANPAYSRRAVGLTFQRERLLNAFGLKSLGTADLYWRRPHSTHIAAHEPGIAARAREVAQPPSAAYKALRRVTSWNNFIRNVVDRFLPKQPYELPPGIIPDDVLARNDAFYASLLEDQPARVAPAGEAAVSP